MVSLNYITSPLHDILSSSFQEKLQRTKKLENRVAKAKEDYSLALKRLEGISYEIHEKRKLKTLSKENDSLQSHAYSPIPQFRKLSLISSTPNRTGKCTAVVYPWTSNEGTPMPPLTPIAGGSHHVSASLSSYSNVSDCDSELGSVETLDTLDDSAISHLMLGSEIENHLKTYMSSSVMRESHASTESEVKTKDGVMMMKRHMRHESM